MKKLILMCGPPGAGKSFRVRQILQETHPAISKEDLDGLANGLWISSYDTVVCSADFYFTNESGEYVFRRDELPLAHLMCQKGVMDAIGSWCSNLVLVDNTNMAAAERRIYELLARRAGYEVAYEVVGSPAEWDPAALAARNTHGVPVEVIRRRIAAYEPPPPKTADILNAVAAAHQDGYEMTHAEAEALAETAVRPRPHVLGKTLPPPPATRHDGIGR